MSINNIVISVLIVSSTIFSSGTFAQCQGQLSNDSGPSNYQEGKVATNLALQKKDYNLSLCENIRKKNLDNNNLVFTMVVVLLMFFSIFSNQKTFSKISIALYAAPLITYYIAFQNLQTDALIFIIISSILMFLWGGSFSYQLQFSRQMIPNLLLTTVFLALVVICFKLVPKIDMMYDLNYINYYLFTGHFEKNLMGIFYLFTGGSVLLIMHLLYTYLGLENRTNLNVDGENLLKQTWVVKTLVFIMWIVIFLFASLVSSYLVTWFIIGSIFKDKNMVKDTFVLIKQYLYLFLFAFTLILVLLVMIFVKQDNEPRDCMIFVNTIFISGLVYFGLVWCLKRLLKEKIKLMGSISTLPFFMISFALNNKVAVTKEMKSIYSVATLIFLLLIAFMI